MDSFRQWYQRHSFRNLLITAELLKLHKLFARQGIPMIAVKGAVLAKQVYGDVRLREFGDLDIVIHMSDLGRTIELLLKNGFVDTFQINIDPDSTYVKSHYNYALSHKTGLFSVEIHWRLWQSEFGSLIKLEDVWQLARPVKFNDREEVLTLTGSDLLLYLCAHGSKHQWSRLSWICDVNELLRSGVEIDWQTVIAQNQRFRSLRMVLFGVYLAHSVFETPLPAPLQSLIARDPEIPALAREIQDRLIQRADHSGELGYYLRIREHWIDKLLHLTRLAGRQMIPNDRDTSLIKLPRRLFFLYYLIRPIRLLLERVLRLNTGKRNPA